MKLGLIKSSNSLVAYPYQYLPLLQIYLVGPLLICLKALYLLNFSCSTIVEGMEQAFTLVDRIEDMDEATQSPLA